MALSKGASSRTAPKSPEARPCSIELNCSNASRRCWKGYEATPGKEPYSEGSCRKSTGSHPDDKKKKKKKKREKKASKKDGGKSSSSSSSSEDESGDRKKKKQKN